MANLPSHDAVLRAFSYDPESGVVLWRHRADAPDNVNAARSGKEAGGFTVSGYKAVGFNGCQIRLHRLIWFYMTGAWPKDQIDHINGNKADNSWGNLREASGVQNSHNTRKRPGSASPLKGAHWDSRKMKWTARICVAGKRTFLGVYDTDEEAHRAWADAAKKLVGDFARIDSSFEGAA